MDVKENQEISKNQNLNIILQNTNKLGNKSHLKEQGKTNDTQQKQNWNSKQIETLFNEYLQNGACWSYMTAKMPQKSTNSIKNKFNNSMRTTSKLLKNFQRQVLGKTKENITKDLLLAALEIVNQAQKAVMFLGLTVNWESKIFSFKSELLKLSLATQKLSNQRIHEILRTIHLINFKMRTYLVFKQKNLRNWKISGKAFKYILTFDKIVTQDIVKLPFQNENERIINPKVNKQGTGMPQQLSPLVTNLEIKSIDNQISLCYQVDSFKQQNFSLLFNKNNDHYFYP